MSLSASLANYDINKLSHEMEKLGGGINIKRESNLAKFVFDPHATQSYAKKDQNAFKDLEATIKKEKLSFSGSALEYAEEAFASNEVVNSLLGKGFNVNVINFSTKGLIFGFESEFILNSFTDLQNCHLDFQVQLSLFRVSYDAESNQEFYLDLLNLDYSSPTTNNLRDLNLVKVTNTDELRKLLAVAAETDYNFSDNRIFSCYVLCMTLYDEDNRYFSNLMIIDCDVAENYKDQTKEYAQRFTNDLKLILKEASALKLINIDTLNERIKKKSKISQFFYSNVLKNAKNIVISTLSPDATLNYDFGEILTSFTGFEVICYRSKNISSTFLSTGANIIQYNDFMKDHQKSRKKSSKSPLRTNPRQTTQKPDAKKKKGESKQEYTEIDFQDPELDPQSRKILIPAPQKKSTYDNGAPMSVEMLEEGDSIEEAKPKDQIPKAMKQSFRGKPDFKENTSPTALTFKKDFADYKKVHRESNDARKEILKENERLEAEIANLRTNYEREIEGYRQSIMEMNAKLHIILDQEQDDRLKLIIEAYESDVRRLELHVKSLREQIEIINQVNTQQETGKGGLDLEGTGKLKEMVKVLNLELINKENIISKYRYQERDKENKVFLNERTQEENRMLFQENKKLKAENTQIVQQLRDLTDIYENLKKKNTEIYNEMQEQYMTSLHITEENNILRDLVKSKKIEVPPHINVNESFARSPTSQKVIGKKMGEKKTEVFHKILEELRECIETNIKLESRRPIHLLDRIECQYKELNTRYDELLPKQQKYLDFLGDLQVKMEEHLGKSDELVKRSNKEIRKFLAEVIG